MDALSEALALLDVRVALPSRFEAGGDWSLAFKLTEQIKVGALLAGRCWLIAEGGEPTLLETGDCYLLASGRPYVVASDPELPPSDGHAVFAAALPGPVRYNVVAGDPSHTILAGGAVAFDDTTAALLLDHLPPCVRIDAASRCAQVLHPTLRVLAEEAADDAPGAAAMREQLTRILFVQALRTLLMSPDGPLPGWLGALADEHIGAALTAIHRRPGHPWTVAELAASAGMSRSTFALRFKTQVGLSPLDYLSRWRIRSAAVALRSGDRTVASVAAEFGYGSESAFSNAFKRMTGRSPAHHRRR